MKLSKWKRKTRTKKREANEKQEGIGEIDRMKNRDYKKEHKGEKGRNFQSEQKKR